LLLPGGTHASLADPASLALLCLAVCTPTATASVVPTATATTPLALTATRTPVLASAPTNVPSGWKVLATTDFSLAYPPDWTTQLWPDGGYAIETPTQQPQVIVTAKPKGDVSPYCRPDSPGAQQTTFAGLPMKYMLDGRGAADPVRLRLFANAQHTCYLLQADDFSAGAAMQAQDEAILATFRPDEATPWSC
jgi:hypothetical protein